MSANPLEEIFHPRSIAVIGATSNPDTGTFGFLESLLEYGYKGDIFPINPKHSEILGLKAYSNINDVAKPVDYVISCVPATLVLDMIKDCSQKGVKAIHLYTARFSETGRKEATELEAEVLKKARDANIRLIGPNCMGLYYPGYGISFCDALPKQSGALGLISQSGQMAEDIGRYAQLRDLFFSKAISYGNAIDFNECDFLDYFSKDYKTKIILMYVEGVRDGKRFITSLKNASLLKPVIILKGGRGESGTRATSSHTASMAGSHEVWKNIVHQAGAVFAENSEEMIDIAASFMHLPPIHGFNVGIAGGGGGSSVLAADQCEAAGLNVISMPQEIREELKSRGSGIWDWIGNPADMSIRDRADFTPGEIIKLMAKHKSFDFLIAIMNDPHHKRQKNITTKAYLDQYSLASMQYKPILAVVPDKSLGINEFDNWAWEALCDIRSKLIEMGVSFYPTIFRAAIAARKMIEYYKRRSNSSQ